MNSATNQILDGMDVYDTDGYRIGKVVRYDRALGYFESKGTFSGPRYIPFWALERIGPTGAYLNVTGDVVSNVYKQMPSVTPSLTGKGQLTGGGTVESGYDGRRVPLDAAAIAAVREKVHKGAPVFDTDGKKLGTIQAYDASTGYMRIEKGGLSNKDVFLPVTSVAFLNDKGIHLWETKDAIAGRFSRVPEIARDFFAL
jgi:hypothetical protein